MCYKIGATKLEVERTPKYRTLNTSNIDTPNFEHFEHEPEILRPNFEYARLNIELSPGWRGHPGYPRGAAGLASQENDGCRLPQLGWRGQTSPESCGHGERLEPASPQSFHRNILWSPQLFLVQISISW